MKDKGKGKESKLLISVGIRMVSLIIDQKKEERMISLIGQVTCKSSM